MKYCHHAVLCLHDEMDISADRDLTMMIAMTEVALHNAETWTAMTAERGHQVTCLRHDLHHQGYLEGIMMAQISTGKFVKREWCKNLVLSFKSV